MHVHNPYSHHVRWIAIKLILEGKCLSFVAKTLGVHRHTIELWFLYFKTTNDVFSPNEIACSALGIKKKKFHVKCSKLID